LVANVRKNPAIRFRLGRNRGAIGGSLTTLFEAPGAFGWE
jgi:hypothetical protein